jgi:hypothetical protein
VTGDAPGPKPEPADGGLGAHGQPAPHEAAPAPGSTAATPGPTAATPGPTVPPGPGPTSPGVGAGPAPAAGGPPGWGSWPPGGAAGRDVRKAEHQARREARAERGIGGSIWGVLLVLIGAGLLASELIPGFDWDVAWPAVLVGFGILLVLASIRRTPIDS